MMMIVIIVVIIHVIPKNKTKIEFCMKEQDLWFYTKCLRRWIYPTSTVSTIKTVHGERRSDDPDESLTVLPTKRKGGKENEDPRKGLLHCPVLCFWEKSTATRILTDAEGSNSVEARLLLVYYSLCRSNIPCALCGASTHMGSGSLTCNHNKQDHLKPHPVTEDQSRSHRV